MFHGWSLFKLTYICLCLWPHSSSSLHSLRPSQLAVPPVILCVYGRRCFSVSDPAARNSLQIISEASPSHCCESETLIQANFTLMMMTVINNISLTSGLQKLSDEVLVWLFVWSRCKWFVYGPADGTATPSSLASLKSRLVYGNLSGAGLPRLSWKWGH